MYYQVITAALGWNVGDRIVVNLHIKSDPEYYIGHITSIKSGKLFIEFDDGDTYKISEKSKKIFPGNKKKRKSEIPADEIEEYLAIEKPAEKLTEKPISQIVDNRNIERIKSLVSFLDDRVDEPQKKSTFMQLRRMVVEIHNDIDNRSIKKALGYLYQRCDKILARKVSTVGPRTIKPLIKIAETVLKTAKGESSVENLEQVRTSGGGTRITKRQTSDEVVKLNYKDYKSTNKADRIRYLEATWDEFNKKYFGNKLKKPGLFKLSNAASYGGYYRTERYRNGQLVTPSTITVGSDAFKAKTPGIVKETVLHEMCHQAQFEIDKAADTNETAHGPLFKKWAVKVGLPKLQGAWKSMREAEIDCWRLISKKEQKHYTQPKDCGQWYCP